MNRFANIDLRVPAKQAWQGSEHSLQVAVISHSLAYAGFYPQITLLHAIPNGGMRGWKAGKSLKAEGVLEGVPDLFLPFPSNEHHGFYLELKNAKGTVKPQQWAIMHRLENEGYCVKLTNSLPVAIHCLESYLNAQGNGSPDIKSQPTQ